nr:PREDICTED: kelch domain-containing protein 4 [Bemisia tabaci]
MGKKDKKKGKGAAKTAAKTEKKQAMKLKKKLASMGEEDIERAIMQMEQTEANRKKTEETVVNSPSRRANSSFIPHPTKDALILFGGEFYNGSKNTIYGDFYMYNLNKKEWTAIKAPNHPPPRCGHQMVGTTIDGGQLWMFGGEYLSASSSQVHHYKELWLYHITNKIWQKINAPNGPSARSGHRMVLCKKQLIVFGGYYDNFTNYIYYNDVHSFSLEDYTWRPIVPSGVAPAPRSGCCMAALPDGRILIYGGYSKEKIKKDVDKGTVHNDMFLLTPDKNDSTGLKWKWVKVKPGGARPLPRSGLSMAVTVPATKAYTFGGVYDVEESEEDLSGTFFNDLHLLDLEQVIWRTVTLKGAKKVEGETMDADMEESELEPAVSTVVDDGIFKVTVGPALPQKAAKTPDPSKQSDEFAPSPRMSSGLAIKNGVLYLYGGLCEVGDKTITLCDFYSLDIGKLNGWKAIEEDKSQPHEWIDENSDSESGSDDDSMDDEDDDDDTDDSSDSEEKMDTD